jgi:hypothetical protein
MGYADGSKFASVGMRSSTKLALFKLKNSYELTRGRAISYDDFIRFMMYELSKGKGGTG